MYLCGKAEIARSACGRSAADSTGNDRSIGILTGEESD